MLLSPGGQASSSSQPAVQVQPVRPVALTGQTGQTGSNDRSEAQGNAPDLQDKASGRGYLEDECSEAAGETYKSGTYLWAVAEQVY